MHGQEVESQQRFYAEAEKVLDSTNKKVAALNELMAGLRAEALLAPEPFDEPIEFMEFDFWQYYGRTAKHGTFFVKQTMVEMIF